MRFLLVAILLLPILPVNAERAQPDGGAMMYVGIWPNKILVIDEKQEKVVDKISLETGTPLQFTLSQDRKKLLVLTTRMSIEVVDLAARKVTRHFSLNEGDRSVFPLGAATDPHGRYLYATLRAATKEIDRFKLEKAKFAVIDLEEKKIVKTFDFPKEYDQGFGFMAAYKVSPDGKLLYVFKDDILIFDLNDFKQVDKIELSKPLHPGLFPINFRGDDDPNEEPGFVTSVFNATDPVMQRSIFGIARINLTTKNVDFTPIGPATPMHRFFLTPDRKKGFTVAFSGQGANRRTEFWVFDVEARKVVKKSEFESRSRFNFGVSSDGRKLFIYGAGPTIEIYDSETLKLQRTITLEGDAIGQMLILRPST